MNENIRQKLFHYSETPPPAAWNHIADALDENGAFVQRLYDFEAQPASGVWETIDQQLTAAVPHHAIPLRTKLFKYAIAAAVLLAVAASSVLYLNRDTTSGLAHTSQKAPTSFTADDSSADIKMQSASETERYQSNSPSHEDYVDENGTAQVDGAVMHYAHKARLGKDQLTTSEWNVMPEEKRIINTNVPDRYIIATTQTGKVVRVPKKVYSDYVCAEAYQNYQCKERIAALQSKMAASVATDFTDFIDLLKKLQDNP